METITYSVACGYLTGLLIGIVVNLYIYRRYMRLLNEEIELYKKANNDTKDLFSRVKKQHNIKD